MVHILDGHAAEFGLQSKEPSPHSAHVVSEFVASILSTPASVLCEFSDMRGNHKMIAVKSRRGSVVLQPRIDAPTNEAYYSVVTATRAEMARGMRVAYI